MNKKHVHDVDVDADADVHDADEHKYDIAVDPITSTATQPQEEMSAQEFSYGYVTKRTPAWTDRVLFKSRKVRA